MHSDPGELAARYAALTEPDLLILARDYDSLTDPAQTALSAEFKHRGLQPPLIEEELTSVNLVTVERYRDLSESDRRPVLPGVRRNQGLALR
jgi:hypothetical protein